MTDRRDKILANLRRVIAVIEADPDLAPAAASATPSSATLHVAWDDFSAIFRGREVSRRNAAYGTDWDGVIDEVRYHCTVYAINDQSPTATVTL